MAKAQQQARLDCQRAGCKFISSCTVCWGKKCNRQGGKKIPRFQGKPYRCIPDEYSDVVTIPRKLILGGENRW